MRPTAGLSTPPPGRGRLGADIWTDTRRRDVETVRLVPGEPYAAARTAVRRLCKNWIRKCALSQEITIAGVERPWMIRRTRRRYHGEYCAYDRQ